MNLDYLSRLLTPPLEERAAHEGRALAGNSTEPLEVDAYFKKVDWTLQLQPGEQPDFLLTWQADINTSPQHRDMRYSVEAMEVFLRKACSVIDAATDEADAVWRDR